MKIVKITDIYIQYSDLLIYANKRLRPNKNAQKFKTKSIDNRCVLYQLKISKIWCSSKQLCSKSFYINSDSSLLTDVNWITQCTYPLYLPNYCHLKRWVSIHCTCSDMLAFLFLFYTRFLFMSVYTTICNTNVLYKYLMLFTLVFAHP